MTKARADDLEVPVAIHEDALSRAGYGLKEPLRFKLNALHLVLSSAREPDRTEGAPDKGQRKEEASAHHEGATFEAKTKIGGQRDCR
eukprot:14247073-Alexandrium_andersonii.AAC.2